MAVGPATGRLIHALASSPGTPRILELGTSLGYSTLWLADAARHVDGCVITLELEAEKSTRACEMAKRAGLSPWVDFRMGDALALLPMLKEAFDFVLVDQSLEGSLPEKFRAFSGSARARGHSGR